MVWPILQNGQKCGGGGKCSFFWAVSLFVIIISNALSLCLSVCLSLLWYILACCWDFFWSSTPLHHPASKQIENALSRSFVLCVRVYATFNVFLTVSLYLCLSFSLSLVLFQFFLIWQIINLHKKKNKMSCRHNYKMGKQAKQKNQIHWTIPSKPNWMFSEWPSVKLAFCSSISGQNIRHEFSSPSLSQ